jgi:hypothetical protein
MPFGVVTKNCKSLPVIQQAKNYLQLVEWQRGKAAADELRSRFGPLETAHEGAVQ